MYAAPLALLLQANITVLLFAQNPQQHATDHQWTKTIALLVTGISIAASIMDAYTPTPLTLASIAMGAASIMQITGRLQ